MIYEKFFKKAIDLVLSSLMLIVLFPIFFLLIISLSVHHRGNPFFAQPRLGRYNEQFKLLKFKTMKELYGKNGQPLCDSLRITPFGKLVRNTSLDEIPQLINVIIGNMSLVGPRPLLVEYLELYAPEQLRRHEVLPGVTGWAQVNGRNAISWENKFQLDIWYVDHCTAWLDVRILIKTFFNVLMGKGVSQLGHVSMRKFNGKYPA